MKAENGSIASEGNESQVIANIVKVNLAGRKWRIWVQVKDYNPSGYICWLPRDKRFVKISSLGQKWIVRKDVYTG